MDFKLIIADLMADGMTQAEIAVACQTGQSHISAIYRGARVEPRWGLGDKLLRLHQQRRSGIGSPLQAA